MLNHKIDVTRDIWKHPSKQLIMEQHTILLQQQLLHRDVYFNFKVKVKVNDTENADTHTIIDGTLSNYTKPEE